MNPSMEREDRALLEKIVGEDGPIRILLSLSCATGLDDEPRVIAQSLRYGQMASGATPDIALSRVIVQIVGYLRDCEAKEFSYELRKNWAPKEALTAFSMADPFDPDRLPEHVARFFEPKSRVPMLEVNELHSPLEDFVSSQQLVSSY